MKVRPQRQAKQEAQVRLEKADLSSDSSSSEEESELETEEHNVSEVGQAEPPPAKSTESTKVVEGEDSESVPSKKRKSSTKDSSSDKFPMSSDEKRCRRNDGKKWQCAKPKLEGSPYCQYHKDYNSNKNKTPRTPKEKEPKTPKEKERKVKESKVKEPKSKTESASGTLNDSSRTQRKRISRVADTKAEDLDYSENDQAKSQNGKQVRIQLFQTIYTVRYCTSNRLFDDFRYCTRPVRHDDSRFDETCMLVENA